MSNFHFEIDINKSKLNKTLAINKFIPNANARIYLLVIILVTVSVSSFAQRQQEVKLIVISADHGILPEVGYEFSLTPKSSVFASIGYTTESVSTGKVIGIDTIFGSQFHRDIFEQVNANILLIDLGYKYYFKPRKWHNHGLFISLFLYHKNFVKIPEKGIVFDEKQFGWGFSFGHKWMLNDQFSLTADVTANILYEGTGDVSFGHTTPEATADASIKFAYVFNAQKI